MLGSTSRPASCFALLLSLPSVASSHRHSGHLLEERGEKLDLGEVRRTRGEGRGTRAEGLEPRD